MHNTTLKSNITSWLKTFSYWFQFAGSKFLNGESLTPKLIDETYQLFLEDEGLIVKAIQRDEIAFLEVTEGLDGANELRLDEVKDIANVNALAAGQNITANEQLTIIYGGNGTGKSGYIRMLNNAFYGRGDKEILANVFERSNGTPSCKFTFKSGTENLELTFPDDKGNDAFTRFSVFDTHCVKVHLQQENKLLFTPSGFEFFDKAVALFEALKLKLQGDINNSKPSNDFIPLFKNVNSIQAAILALGAETNVEVIKQLATYGEVETQRVEELTAKKVSLNALNISQQIIERQQTKGQIKGFQNDLKSYLDFFSKEKLNSITSTIRDYRKYKELSTAEGVSSLQEYEIEGLGSEQWRQFIVGAKEYANSIKQANDSEEEYPTDDDHCLFCLQPLTQKENRLITTYWSFIQSEAEEQMKRLSQILLREETSLKNLKPIIFDETSTVFNSIYSIDSVLATKWQEIVTKVERQKDQLIENISTKENLIKLEEVDEAISEFDDILQKIDNRINTLSSQDPAMEIATIETELHLLGDKNLLNKLLQQVTEFIEKYKWAKKAESKLTALRPNAITIKQGQLFEENITKSYTKTFNGECSKLNAPKIVSITQRNTKGQTLRKLQVENQFANKILSEGEQRSICLADFLTEVQLNPNNSGIIFDDPVTSLDHQRRDLIAKRLAEEALDRQVIIFTHDISFLLQLQYYADNVEGLSYSITTIRKQAGQVGIIQPTLPWVAQKVKDRIAYLRNALLSLRKIEKEGTEDAYISAAKTWYGLLREGWERAVEERLLKGVVERYGPAIQTQRIKKISITAEMVNDIEKGMTESSRWVHDAAAGLNPTIPDTIKAEEDFKFFEDFAKGCVAA